MAVSTVIETDSFQNSSLSRRDPKPFGITDHMELGRNYDILTWRLQGARSASELTQHIKLWLMQGLGHPVLTHSDNVQARFLLQNSEEIVRMHDLITPYVVGKAALEAAVTSKSQAWRGPSSPTSRYIDK